MLSRLGLRSTASGAVKVAARAFHSAPAAASSSLPAVSPAAPALFHRMPQLSPLYTFSSQHQHSPLHSSLVAVSSAVPSNREFNALLDAVADAVAMHDAQAAVAAERASKTLVPYAGALLAVETCLPAFELELDGKLDSAAEAVNAMSVSVDAAAVDGAVEAALAAGSPVLSIDGDAADAFDEMSFTSVLRKRKSKMNKHKLKKRRRAERFRNRRTTSQ